MSRTRLGGLAYVLTSNDIETTLASVTPKMVGHIITLLGIDHADWDKLDVRVKAKHIVDFQNTAMLAATMAAAAKAHTDLEAAASPITERVEAETLRDEVRALTQLVHDMRTGHDTKKGGKK